MNQKQDSSSIQKTVDFETNQPPVELVISKDLTTSC
jgi:hypothetical protein